MDVSSTSTIAKRASSLARMLRPHQWAKNLLLFVPLLTAHRYGEVHDVIASLLAFVALCATASSAYIINDLLDLDADRGHPRKRNRPIASGAVPPMVAHAVAIALAAAGFALGFFLLPPLFVLTLLVYFGTTCLYSVWLKRVSTIDVVTLAGLYTLRVLAGAAAIAVVPSFWLLAFSMFLFLSLAYVKRYEELRATAESSRVAGRGYAAADAESMFVLGSVSGVASVLVMALYINSPEIATYYNTPQFLWGLCPALLYWINRIWIGARRGKIHEDPVVFALTDRVSIATGLFCLLTVLAAHFVRF